MMQMVEVEEQQEMEEQQETMEADTVELGLVKEISSGKAKGGERNEGVSTRVEKSVEEFQHPEDGTRIEGRHDAAARSRVVVMERAVAQFVEEYGVPITTSVMEAERPCCSLELPYMSSKSQRVSLFARENKTGNTQKSCLFSSVH